MLDEWQTVERELGVRFPTDYRDFVLNYGSGQLARFYEVWNPFSGAAYIKHV
jgi:SMI1-KNR4 cell-wall